MYLTAKLLIGVVLAIHVYVVLLETVLFRTRGRKAFGLNMEQAEILAPALSNQGCYNGFLVAALAVSFLHPDPSVAYAFAVYGLSCVAVAGIWGAMTVQKSILLVQTVPAAFALLMLYLASTSPA